MMTPTPPTDKHWYHMQCSCYTFEPGIKFLNVKKGICNKLVHCAADTGSSLTGASLIDI